MAVAAAALLAIALAGCSSSPPLTQTGFLSDYSKLQDVSEQRMAFMSPELKAYRSFIIEPVQILVPPKQFTPDQRTELANYFSLKLKQLLEKRGLTAATRPGPGVAAFRIAITEVAESNWLLRIHPATRLSGAGTGGAAMEGEVVDSVTGKQLGAVVQSSPGNQFDLTAFSTMADVKAAIDKWAEITSARLDALGNAR